MASERLDKALSNRADCTRREAAALIRAGKVTVNGIPCRDQATRIDLRRDVVLVAGQPLRVRRERYFMLNKPAGVVSARQDAQEKTILDLFPPEQRPGLSPVGRLDKDTEGLLLVTDDGELSHAMTSPRRHVAKRYRARVSGVLDEAAPARFAQGVELRDGTQCLPAELTVGQRDADGLLTVEIVLHEGKYHQVKRMIAACGGHVVYLERLSMGELTLDPALARGQWRPLTEEEISRLLEAADL